MLALGHYFSGYGRRAMAVGADIHIARAIPVIPLIFITIMLTAFPAASQFREVRQLTSNNIIALAGNGDTLWLATERGFNYRIGSGNEWRGFESNDIMYGPAFGGRRAAALIYNSDRYSPEPIGFWQFDHASGSQRQKFFRFSSGVADSAGPAGSMMFSQGSFWAPFNHGGMVRYDPVKDSVYAIRPGDAAEVAPQDLSPLDSNDNSRNSKIVLSLDVNPADNSILVTTPSMLWLYHPASKAWDTLQAKPTLAQTEETSFAAAFYISKGNTPALYSFITATRGGQSNTALYSFGETEAKWFRAIDSLSRFSVYPAIEGSMYALNGNQAWLFADTLAAGSGRENHLSKKLSPDDFRAMLARAGDNPDPEINDILFLPGKSADNSGLLAVATKSGLYICEQAKPLTFGGNDYNFTLIREVRSLKAGEVYALPGVMRGSHDGRYDKSVFVYNLRKDGKVTIKVYDYNMSLVKTVVKGERRSAGTNAKRSTNPARDIWDGTNEAGKRAWPGVYYFKITSTGGDRLLGKIVLAK
jgi:hypothetical protein